MTKRPSLKKLLKNTYQKKKKETIPEERFKIEDKW